MGAGFDQRLASRPILTSGRARADHGVKATAARRLSYGRACRFTARVLPLSTSTHDATGTLALCKRRAKDCPPARVAALVAARGRYRLQRVIAARKSFRCQEDVYRF